MEEKLRSIYSEVFNDSEELRPMRGPSVGEPMTITLKEDFKPFAIQAARQVPYAYVDKLKEMLDYMETRKIIVPVGDVPTEWCHPVVIVPKPNGELRFCVDLTKLNAQVLRTIHHTKTPAEAVGGFLPTDRYFAKIDLMKGYWQMPLHPDVQDLTTFITMFWRYKFLRSPMGFVSTGDSFSYRGDVAMDGLRVHKVVDDIAIGHSSFQGMISLLCDVLKRCAKHGLTVSKEKSVLATTSIKFVGYQISHGSIEADPSKLIAIENFPTPTTKTELRSFLGLVNQLGGISSNVAKSAGPMRDLLRKRSDFAWYPDHTKAFENVKRALVSPPVLGMFNPSFETVLQTDASRLHGLGFALLQKQSDQWRLIQCSSRFLKDAETRYAVLELEPLAIFWAIRKCQMYLRGLPFFCGYIRSQAT